MRKEEAAGAINAKELLHQNHELKKKLIRIEYEAKRERSMLLMQFEEMKARMTDMEAKERFIKTSQASLNELISNMKPAKDWSANVEACESDAKSSIENPYAIQDKPTVQRIDLQEFGTPSQETGELSSGLKQPLKSETNYKPQLVRMEKLCLTSQSPTKILRSASSNMGRSSKFQMIPLSSPKISVSEEANKTCRELSETPLEQSPEFKMNLATSSDFATIDFGTKPEEDQRVTREFTPVRMHSTSGIHIRDRPSDLIKNSPRGVIKFDHSSMSKDSRFVTPACFDKYRDGNKNKIIPLIKDFQRDDSESAEIVSTMMQQIDQKSLNLQKKPKQRIFYNVCSNATANNDTLSKSPLVANHKEKASCVEKSPQGTKCFASQYLNINSINIDFTKGKIGVQVKPDLQKSLIQSFKRGNASHQPSFVGQRDPLSGFTSRDATPSRKTPSGIQIQNRQAAHTKMSSNRSFIMPGDAASRPESRSARSSAKRDCESSFATIPNIPKKMIKISDCSSDHMTSTRNQQQTPTKRKRINTSSKSPIAFLNMSPQLKKLNKPINPPPRQNFLRIIQQKKVPSIERNLKPSLQTIKNESLADSFVIPFSSRASSRSKESRCHQQIKSIR